MTGAGVPKRRPEFTMAPEAAATMNRGVEGVDRKQTTATMFG